MTSFLSPNIANTTTNTITNMTSSVVENYECAPKKKKLKNTDSDMEISSDDEIQIIDDDIVDDSKHKCPPMKEELGEKNVTPNFNSFNQTMSTNVVQRPKIVVASNLFTNKPFNPTIDSSEDLLSIESDHTTNITNNIPLCVPSIHQENKNISTSSIINSSSMDNVNNQEQILPAFESKTVKPKKCEKSVADIFNELSAVVDISSDFEKTTATTPHNGPPSNLKQKDAKQPFIEPTLSVHQNIEESPSKSNMHCLFGDDSDDDIKISLVDVKKKSLGVRLGMPSSLSNALKTNKLHEPIKTIKNKTEDPNNKQKKFELSNLVVQLLNPYYKNNVFKSKELFKFLAREIVHKLLESTSNPGNSILFI